MVHSVYSEREIFLRELLSNASDACEKLRYEAVADAALIADAAPFAIRDRASTRTRAPSASSTTASACRATDLTEALGTIARSGTRAFLDRVGDAPDDQG